MDQQEQETADVVPAANLAGHTDPSGPAQAAQTELTGQTEADDGEVADVDVAAVEAILFATECPLSPAKIAEVACLQGGRRTVRRAIDSLNRRYEQVGCSFRIEPLAGGYQMLTLAEYNDVLSRLFKVRSETRLSQAAMETLSIIAYKQPILRADVEAIRGVAAGEVIRSLMEKGLVKITGRAEEIGRPMLYGTTARFLQMFGLSALKDLPKAADLTALVRAQGPKPERQADSADAGTAGDASDPPDAGDDEGTADAEQSP